MNFSTRYGSNEMNRARPPRWARTRCFASAASPDDAVAGPRIRRDTARAHVDRLDEGLVPGEEPEILRRALTWYRANHPVRFAWLEIVQPSAPVGAPAGASLVVTSDLAKGSAS